MTEADKAKAKAIVDQWFWQPDSWRRTSFVRFYESAPMASDVFKLVLDYLKSETATSIVMAGKLIDLGETWKATDAWYQTMPAEKWQGTESTKVRVYQAFRAESDTSAGPYSVENGCQYAVTHQFYWDVAEVPSVPASSSGVGYTLQGVVRDRETGLYSCVVECRTRVQQDVPEYDTQKTVFQDTKEELHLGVKAGTSAGKPASVSNGTMVTRRVTKNADCTTDVQNVTTVDKPVTGAAETVTELAAGTRTTTENRNMATKASTANLAPGESVRNEQTPSGRWNQTIVRFARNAVVWLGDVCRKTVFAHVHTTTTNTKERPNFDHVVEAGGGRVVEKSVRKTDDGYQVSEQTTEEKPVADAAVEARRLLRGTTKTTTSRNQAAPLDMDHLAVGEQRRSQKTDGGLYDNTVVKTTPAQGKFASDCSQTIFEHRDSSTETMSDAPEDEHAEPAGDGKTTRKVVRLTDEGTVDVTTETTQEKPVSDAVVEVRKTLRGTTKTTTSRNQAAPLDMSNLAVGEQRRSQKTGGGLNDNTQTTTTANPVGSIAESDANTIFESQHQKTSVVAAGTMPEVHVDRAGGGKVFRKDVRRNEDGMTADETQSETTELPVAAAEVTKTRTLHGVRTRTVDRNQPGPAPDPVNIGEAVTNRKTNGGLTDVVKETFSAQPAGKTAESQEETRHAKTVETVTNKSSPEPPEVRYADGRIEQKSSRLLDDGTADVAARTVTAKPSQKSETWSDSYGTYTRCVYRNQAKPLLPNKSGDYIHTSVSFQMNDFGLFDGVYTVSDTSKSAGGSGREYSNFTKTVNVKEERIVSSSRDGTSKVQYYQERTWKKVMRYNNNTGWYLDAMNDITSSPGQGAKLSRITGTYTWEYWMDPDEWGPTKKRTIG